MKLLGGFQISRVKQAKNNIKTALSLLPNRFSPDTIYYNSMLKLTRNLDLDSSSIRLLNTARNLSISSPILYGYLQIMESEIYGDKGFILDLNSPNEDFNQKIESIWKQWESSCDYNEEFDFRDIERFALIHYLRDGECFIRMFIDKDEGVKLQVIPPELVDYNLNDGDKIRKGIEFDSNNRVVAYYVLKDDKRSREHIKIHKDQMIHLKRVFNSTQIRGIPHIANVLFKVLQIEKYLEAVISQAHISSGFSLVAKPKEGEDGFNNGNLGDLSEPSKSPEPKTIEMEDGRIIAMNENFDIQPLNINHNPNVDAFITKMMFQIAKGLGVSYISLTGDASTANFSASRLSIQPERRLNKRFQKIITQKVHSKIYEAFIKDLTLKKVLSPKESQVALNNYTFRTQAFDWIDPTKEIPMLKLELGMGTKTMIQHLNDRGIETTAHLKDLKESNDMFLEELTRLQQIYSPHASPATNNANNSDDVEDEENKPKKGSK